MSLSSLKYKFEVRYNVIPNFTSPGFTDEELSVIFNQAQLRLLKERLDPKGNKYGETVEQTEKRKKDFSELVARGTATVSASQVGATFPTAVNGFISKIYDLPSDLLYVLEEHCFINQNLDTCIENGSLSSIKPITHDWLMSNIWNPFKAPYYWTQWRLDIGRADSTKEPSTTNHKRHELISSTDYNIVSYHLTYFRFPKEMDFTSTTSFCELDASIHDELVEKAILIAVESITDQNKLQVQQLSDSQSE